MKTPLPNKTKDQVELNAKIDRILFEAVKAEAKRQDSFLKDVIMWGFQNYLLQANPKLAKELGIKLDK